MWPHIVGSLLVGRGRFLFVELNYVFNLALQLNFPFFDKPFHGVLFTHTGIVALPAVWRKFPEGDRLDALSFLRGSIDVQRLVGDPIDRDQTLISHPCAYVVVHLCYCQLLELRLFVND